MGLVLDPDKESVCFKLTWRRLDGSVTAAHIHQAPRGSVDISFYGAGLQLIPTGRTARLVEESGVLVATGNTMIDNDIVFGLIDTGRR